MSNGSDQKFFITKRVRRMCWNIIVGRFYYQTCWCWPVQQTGLPPAASRTVYWPNQATQSTPQCSAKHNNFDPTNVKSNPSCKTNITKEYETYTGEKAAALLKPYTMLKCTEVPFNRSTRKCRSTEVYGSTKNCSLIRGSTFCPNSNKMT